VPVAVAGVWRDYARQTGAVMIDLADYRRLTGDRLANDGACIAPAPADDVADALAQLAGPGVLEIARPGEIRAISLRIFDRTFAVTYLLEAVAVAIGLAGVAASFAALAAARRREFGMLRHLGLTRRQIGAMLARKALAAGWGARRHAGGGAIGLVLIEVVNRQSFHWSMDLHVPWLSLLLFGTGLVALAAWPPCWPAGRPWGRAPCWPCGRTGDAASPLSARLAGLAAAPASATEFAPVLPGRRLAFPADHGAHPDFRTEWWYATGWLKLPDGSPLGFQVTFFRVRTGLGEGNPSAFAPRQLVLAHAAIADPRLGRLRHDERSARVGPATPASTPVPPASGWATGASSWPQGLPRPRPGRGFCLPARPATRRPAAAQGQAGFSRKAADPRHASYYYSRPQLG
jgi:hypothetical protein